MFEVSQGVSILSDSTTLRIPRLVVLDTAHLAGLVADLVSDSRERRRSAQRFVPDLLDRGWLPLLCWHHVEELLQHRDDQLVDARLRYLHGLPLLAWIRPADPSGGPGSVLDLMRSEVAALLRSPAADPLRVRDCARDDLFVIGAGEAAIPEAFAGWRVLRSALAERQHQARRVAAIARWRANDIDSSQIGTWFDQPVRGSSEVAQALEKLRIQLANEIATRGDKRISDASGMAAQFMFEVARDGRDLDGAVSPALQILINSGLAPEDIDPASTFGETMDLLMFQKRLRIVAEGLGVPWPELKRSVKSTQLPVTLIEQAMRRHSQDQPERKGSELNDTYLLCLAPYADMTFVDKRTLENVRRIRAKDSMVDQLLGGTARVVTIASVLATLSRS